MLVFARSQRPIESQVSVILGLPDRGMAVTEQQLKSRIAEFVVASHVDHRRRASLWRRNSFRPVMKHFCPERDFFSDVASHQPAGEGEIAVTGRAHHGNSATAVRGPRAKAFLSPDRDLEPGERADHGPVRGLLNKAVLDAGFDIAHAESSRADSGRREAGSYWKEAQPPREQRCADERLAALPS